MSAAAQTAIRQLEAARQVVLADAAHYALIIPGILPIIGPQAEVEVRRWGADFLAEAFASPVLALSEKEALSIQILELLNQLLAVPDQDDFVVKSVVQTAASAYPLVFKYIASNPTDASSWHLMASVKSNILKRFDTAPIGVRICCIRFAQRVVQVQTPGMINDPRKPDANEMSLSLVPREHPLIPPPHLEAEASGLLDRLLNVFYEENVDVLLVDATLNGLAGLVRARPATANKIVSAVLTFNPFRRAPPNLNPLERVQVQSLERTTSAFLLNYTRKNQNNAHSSRIANKLSLLKSQRASFIDNKKRGPPVEPNDGPDANKRIRLGASGDSLNIPPLPPGPVSIAQLYTLTEDEALRNFDVQSIPVDLVTRIVISIIQHVDSASLDESINAIRARYLDLTRKPLQTPLDDAGDDEYEPEFEPMEDKEQIINKMDQLPEEDAGIADIDLGPFELPQPAPLEHGEAEYLGKMAISRVFTMASHGTEASGKTSRPEKSGLNRLAGSNLDKDAWLTILTRLATRSAPELLLDAESTSNKAILPQKQNSNSLGDGIRETLWKYVVEDFRHRIDVAISWLNEEWYNDRIMQRFLVQHESQFKSSLHPQPNYEKWTLKLLDAIIPFLDANDKVLVRFLGEIPEVSLAVLDRVKAMARDPDRVSLTVKALYYLVAFKPPCKNAAIDALEDLWNNYTEARASVKPLLAKIRPAAISGANGVKPEPPSVTAAS